MKINIGREFPGGSSIRKIYESDLFTIQLYLSGKLTQQGIWTVVEIGGYGPPYGHYSATVEIEGEELAKLFAPVYQVQQEHTEQDKVVLQFLIEHMEGEKFFEILTFLLQNQYDAGFQEGQEQIRDGLADLLDLRRN